MTVTERKRSELTSRLETERANVTRALSASHEAELFLDAAQKRATDARRKYDNARFATWEIQAQLDDLDNSAV